MAVFECSTEALEANDVGVPGRVAQQGATVASHASCTGLRMSELSTNVPIRKVDVVGHQEDVKTSSLDAPTGIDNVEIGARQNLIPEPKTLWHDVSATPRSDLGVARGA